jgi:hypothetical protein
MVSPRLKMDRCKQQEARSIGLEHYSTEVAIDTVKGELVVLSCPPVSSRCLLRQAPGGTPTNFLNARLNVNKRRKLTLPCSPLSH